jgi:hypothetical protein
MPQVLICRNFLQYNNVQKRIWSGPLHRYTQKDPKEIYFIFFVSCHIFYVFLKFLLEKGNRKKENLGTALVPLSPQGLGLLASPSSQGGLASGHGGGPSGVRPCARRARCRGHRVPGGHGGTAVGANLGDEAW